MEENLDLISPGCMMRTFFLITFHYVMKDRLNRILSIRVFNMIQKLSKQLIVFE